MIYLTVITEEVLSSTGIGRWYDDEYEDKTTIIRYLFCFNPNNEKLYFHNLKYFKNGIILEKDTYRKLKELFSIKELDYTIKDSEWGFPSIEESGNYSYEHYGRTSIHRRQFIDKKATYELSQFLNDGLDFLYIVHAYLLIQIRQRILDKQLEVLLQNIIIHSIYLHLIVEFWTLELIQWKE